jgi:hypothetical protein
MNVAMKVFLAFAAIMAWYSFVSVAGATGQALPSSGADRVTADDYAVWAAALNYHLAGGHPQRVLLRDFTATGSPQMDRVLFKGMPDDLLADFESRSESRVRIDADMVHAAIPVSGLSDRNESKLTGFGKGCEKTSPIVFVSRPGFDAVHYQALVTVGTACNDHEWSTTLRLEKKLGEWMVLHRVLESSLNIDRFPLPRGDARIPNILAVKTDDKGDHVSYDVSFIVPNVADQIFDTISVYRTGKVGTDQFTINYTTQHGNWKANDKAEFTINLPNNLANEFRDWELRFCVGSKARCYPSTNLLKWTPAGQNE